MNPVNEFETLKCQHGIYESYYFRGNHSDGRHAFWLKHNLLRFKGEKKIRLDNIFIYFDRSSKSAPLVLQQSKILSDDEISKMRNSDWDNFKINFEGDDYFFIASGKVNGKIGELEWNFKLQRSNVSYFHFDKKWFYRGFFPKKKILTRDIDLGFSGEIKLKDNTVSGEFKGMNGHNWGKEHAYCYAYADANQFTDMQGNAVSAFFDGFSAKIKIAGCKTPYLSSGALLLNHKWYVFNQVLSSYKHEVRQLDARNWCVSFLSDTHKLEVDIIGTCSEQSIPWVALMYDHPSGRVSKVENTKFAKAHLRLYENDQIMSELKTDFFELETLFPRSSFPLSAIYANRAKM